MLRSLFKNFKTPPSAAPDTVSSAHGHALPTPALSVQEPAPAGEDLYARLARVEAEHGAEAGHALLREHLATEPADHLAIATLAGRFFLEGRIDDADALLAPAVLRFPGVAPILFNAGRIAYARMRIDEAIGYYRRALAAQPGQPMPGYLLSLALFLKGEYPEALLLMRARNELSGGPTSGWPREVTRWMGEPLEGKRLLIWLDWGGLGDELQFARYIAPLARQYRPGQLIFGCSRECQSLYEHIPGVDLASSALSDITVDYQVALLDLGIIFSTALDNMPPAAPYLSAPAGRREVWAQKLAGITGRKIGLCWSSGFWGAQSNQSGKAISLARLAPLAALTDACFISLQKGPGRAELADAPFPVLDFDADLHDMGDTAALIENLDLVISVDTSVAHLAGAVGKPVVMMLKWQSGTFWLLEREDSPWYPTMRIARQAGNGDWDSVVQRVLTLASAALEGQAGAST